MSEILRSLVRDLPLKIVALLTAVFLWFFGVLDRSYTRTVTVPIALGKGGTKRIISDIDTRSAVVTLEGKGKDLLGVHFRQLVLLVTPPEGKVGSRQLRLNAADLKLPPNITVRAIDPEFVDLRLNEASMKSVVVVVPTTGQPPNGAAITVNRPPARVRLLGSADDVKLVTAVQTETLNLATVSQPGTRRLRVIPPEGESFSTEPESADIVIALEREGARIFLNVPVKAVVPEGRTAEVDPPEAQIAIAGPASKMDSLKMSDIVAQIKVSGLGPGDYQLAAELSLPPEFHLVKCEPQLFDVTVK